MNLLNVFDFFQNIDYDIMINVTLAGLVIVFSMLIILVIIITIFGAFMSLTGKKAKKEKAPKLVKEKAKPVVAAPVVAVSNNDDDELIAVISAAVYSMYEGTGVKPVIKAIRPSSSVNPWKYAGVRQNMRSFF